MEYYEQNITNSMPKKGEDIMNLLYNMKRTNRNHALLSEYFLYEFSYDPERIISIMRLIKTELEDTSNPNREKLARRYLNIFSFLCDKFWLYQDKLELDDLCFSITDPEEYLYLSKELERYRKKSQKVINKIQNIFYDALKDLPLEIEISGRYKNILSIHKKCKKKKTRDVFKLGDIFAFRIIIEWNSENCFEVAHVLHDTFIPLAHRYKDYVSIPKINGYQSVHTWLIGLTSDLDLAAEVQIRTRGMHEIAQSGIAAHFIYANSKSSTLVTEKEKKLLNHLEEIAETIPKNPYVYCLSPHGEFIRLSYGSTALDFASKIHTKLAKKARYALVNSQKQKLNYTMRNFDTIEIITS